MKTRLTQFSSQPNPASARSSSFCSRPLRSTRLLLTIVVLIAPALASADEPMLKFSQALRDGGYFDVAVEYLNQVDPSELSAESQSRLPLEKATTFSRAASVSRDLREAETMLTAAQQAIDAYQPKDATDLDAANTARFRGDLYFNQARISKARASSKKTSETQRKELTDQRRTYLKSSEKAYQASTKSLSTAIKNFQIDPESGSSTNKLQRMRAQYTYLKTRGPLIKEQLAGMSDDKARTKLLEQAATEAKSVWEKYRSYSPAIASTLTAARCYQDLGKLEASQEMVDELLSLQRAEVPASVRRDALSIAAKNWQSVKPFPWETVLAETESDVKRLTPQQSLEPQWQTVQLALAQALFGKSKSLAGEKAGSAKRDAQEASDAAIKLAQSVAQSGGDSREQAINFLKEFGSGAAAPSAIADTADVKAESFARAVQLGKANLPEIESLLRKINAAKRQVRRSAAPQKQAKQNELDKLRKEQFSKTGAALNLFKQAIMLANETVATSQINNVRYLQSYCYFARQQYIESSVIAEFLLENYPNVSGTRQAASILLRNQVATLEAATDDGAFEKRQLIESCKSILDRYPDTTEASSAAARLAQLSLGDSDFDAAKNWFEKIPAGDAQRARLALSFGRRLWFDWSKNQKANDPNGKSKQLVIAKQYLTEGVTSSSPKTLTYAAAEGALLLAQAQLASGETVAAIQRLESDEIAPLTLIEPAHPALDAVGRTNVYHQEVALTAIKAYMAEMSASKNGQQKWIDKAGTVIMGLQKRLKQSGKAADTKRLTSIYQLISQRLIEQFDLLAAGQPRNDFAKALASFLTPIEKQSKEARTVVWAGSTLLSVADTLQQDGAKTEAAPIYAQAVSALDRAEELGFGEGKDAAAMAREIKRQRALAQRGAGNFDDALQQFTQLLTDRSGDLSVQLDAAKTLHQKASAGEDANGFATAILGSTPVANPKTKRKSNAIWGWRKLVKVTRGKSQFQDAFYQSLYHMIEARFEMGRINQSADGVGKALEEIDNWQQRDPDFDNGIWEKKFGQLRQRINQQ